MSHGPEHPSSSAPKKESHGGGKGLFGFEAPKGEDLGAGALLFGSAAEQIYSASGALLQGLLRLIHTFI